MNYMVGILHIAALAECDLLKPSIVPRIPCVGKTRMILNDAPKRNAKNLGIIVINVRTNGLLHL